MKNYLTQFDLESDRFDRLPRVCLAHNPGTNEPILIHRGTKGYSAIHKATDVERFNAERGITEAQVEAMLSGSMFGWDVPAADPQHHEP